MSLSVICFSDTFMIYSRLYLITLLQFCFIIYCFSFGLPINKGSVLLMEGCLSHYSVASSANSKISPLCCHRKFIVHSVYICFFLSFQNMPTGSVEVVLKEFNVINPAKKQLPFVIRDFHKVNAVIDKCKLESYVGYCEEFLKMCVLKWKLVKMYDMFH